MSVGVGVVIAPVAGVCTGDGCIADCTLRHSSVECSLSSSQFYYRLLNRFRYNQRWDEIVGDSVFIFIIADGTLADMKCCVKILLATYKMKKRFFSI